MLNGRRVASSSWQGARHNPQCLHDEPGHDMPLPCAGVRWSDACPAPAVRGLPGRASSSCQRAGRPLHAPLWGACAACQGAHIAPALVSLLRRDACQWQRGATLKSTCNVSRSLQAVRRHLCYCRKSGVKIHIWHQEVCVRHRCACTAEEEEAGCRAGMASCVTLWTAACFLSARKLQERLLLQRRCAKQLWLCSEASPMDTDS